MILKVVIVMVRLGINLLIGEFFFFRETKIENVGVYLCISLANFKIDMKNGKLEN